VVEAAWTSEMLVNFYQTTKSYNPEDSHLGMSRVQLPFICIKVSSVSTHRK
jgi:hypothetical protein